MLYKRSSYTVYSNKVLPVSNLRKTLPLSRLWHSKG